MMHDEVETLHYSQQDKVRIVPNFLPKMSLIFIHCHCLSVPCFMYFMTALYICIKKHFKTRVKTERKEMKMIYFPSSADL